MIPGTVGWSLVVETVRCVLGATHAAPSTWSTLLRSDRVLHDVHSVQAPAVLGFVHGPFLALVVSHGHAAATEGGRPCELTAGCCPLPQT